MDDLKLKATHRDIVGKKTRFLRRTGITPIHLFGHDLESRALQCDTAKLERIITRAGMTRPISLDIGKEEQSGSVFIREIQRDTVKRQLLHVDFYLVRKGEKIKVDVPIVFVGEAPAMREKGRILTHGVSRLSIECLPGNIPAQIEVDLGPLEDLERAIHVKDIVLNPDITVNTDLDQLVVKVSEMAAERVEEVVAKPEVEVEGAAAGEVKAEAEGPAKEAPGEQATK